MNLHNPIIDVHGHYGQYFRDIHPNLCTFRCATAQQVTQRAAACGITCTIVSPLSGLVPRFEGKPFESNIEAQQEVETNDELRQWVIVDPHDPRTYDQAADMLKHPRCVGIKIHPEEHGYPIREHGDALFAFAAKHEAVVLTHTGESNSWPMDFVPFANEYAAMTLILAHLGNGEDQDPTHQVRAIQASTQGNVYVDTSSATSINPGLIEWAVEEVGSQRILFGTDTPLYYAAMQVARIAYADISETDKAAIFSGNALRLIKKLPVALSA